jgi:probable F420-dependent oxidoreductase
MAGIIGVMDIGRVGIWSGELRRHAERGTQGAAEAAAELEELGYGALFIPGSAGGDVLGAAGRLLGATRRAVVATGILNVWMHEPADVAAGRAALAADHPERFLLGLGISHASIVDREREGRYRRPLSTMRAYLDALDGADPPVPAAGRVLAALGPRMLELARDRSAGAHPYFVPVEHTRAARAALGGGPLLAPEQAVLLETDAGRARERARSHLERYLALPNYTNNLLRHGLGEDDLRDGGSDRLVDAIVAWGDEEAIAARVRAHHQAGADHVCVQVVGLEGDALPREEWRRLAPALSGA